jgi:nitroreductase
MKSKENRRNFLKKSAFLGSATIFSHLLYTTDTAEGATSIDAGIWEIFSKRRSVRRYKPDVVPEKDILRIIDAARSAPTSGNQQPWKFLVIRDKDKINRLKEACVKDAVERFYERVSKTQTKEEFENACRKQMSGYFSAPVYIVVLTDNNSKYPTYNHWDGPLAAGYLMLAARALGYGTVHITDSIPEIVTKEVLNIPDHYTRVCITPVGIPVEWPDSPPKKKLEEFIAFESLSS